MARAVPSTERCRRNNFSALVRCLPANTHGDSGAHRFHLHVVACDNASMTYSERYGLVHPNAGAAYAAHALWFRFGSEPDFLATLDDLFEETIPLLDVVAPLLHPVSSVEDLSAEWEEIVLLAETDQNTEVLIEQTRLIEHRVDGWGPLLIAGHADARPRPRPSRWPTRKRTSNGPLRPRETP